MDNYTIKDLCEELVDCGAADIAYHITSAHKRELAEKDDKIADYKMALDATHEDVLVRNMLINELADELETQVDCDDDCNECGDRGNCPTAAQSWRKLIAKAREVVK